MWRPTSLLAVLGLLVAPMLAFAATADDNPEFVIDGGAGLSPAYTCKPQGGHTVCRTDTELTTPKGVGVGIRQRGHLDKGHLEVSYNQYRFKGHITFTDGKVSSAQATGHAEAAWSMGFRDGSELWGTIATSRLRLYEQQGVVFEIHFLIKVAGGMGRFSDRTGACPAGGCPYEQRVVTANGDLRPEDLTAASGRAVARMAASSGRLDLELREGKAQLLAALPRAGRIMATDQRRLQLAVEQGSRCSATVASAGSQARAAGTPVSLGTVRAGGSNAAVFRGAIVRSMHAEFRAVPSAGNGPESFALRANCTTPDGETLTLNRRINLVQAESRR
jgi:hypothetical protein